MYMKFGVALWIALATVASAETVTTTDGRKINLNADGTYEVLSEVSSTPIPMKELKAFLEPFAGEYGQNSVRFMPIYLNESEKAVVGFKFRSVFKSAFGDEIFSFDGESSEKVAPGKASTAETFYFFEDNQFIPGEPYDKLLVFAGAGTGTISTSITAVVYEDGTVIKAAP